MLDLSQSIKSERWYPAAALPLELYRAVETAPAAMGSSYWEIILERTMLCVHTFDTKKDTRELSNPKPRLQPKYKKSWKKLPAVGAYAGLAINSLTDRLRKGAVAENKGVLESNNNLSP